MGLAGHVQMTKSCRLNEKKKKQTNKKTWLLLGMVEEKVYCGYEGRYSERQRHLGESRVDSDPEPCEEKGEGKGESQETRRVIQVCVRMCKCEHTCACVWGLKFDVFLTLPHTVRQCVSLKLKLMCSARLAAGQWTWGISLSGHQVFMCLLVLMRVQRALYWPSPSPRPWIIMFGWNTGVAGAVHAVFMLKWKIWAAAQIRQPTRFTYLPSYPLEKKACCPLG